MTGTLTAVDPGPLPPSYEDMASAILAFHAEFYDMHWSDYSGTPADLTILSLGERLLACRAARSVSRVAGRTGEEGGK